MERVAAEIEQRNRNVGTPSFRGAGPQDADDKICMSILISHYVIPCPR